MPRRIAISVPRLVVGAKFGNGPWDGGSRLYGDANVKSWSGVALLRKPGGYATSVPAGTRAVELEKTTPASPRILEKPNPLLSGQVSGVAGLLVLGLSKDSTSEAR